MADRRDLPVKLYYRIGEVSEIVGVEPHVLRYWESEFRSIRPQKSPKGQRVYSRRDLEKLLRVKELLYTEGFTIAGAKRQLKEGGVASGEAAPLPQRETDRRNSPLLERERLGGELGRADEMRDPSRPRPAESPTVEPSSLGGESRGASPSLRGAELQLSLMRGRLLELREEIQRELDAIDVDDPSVPTMS